MNKTGITDLQWAITLVLLVLTAAALLIYWINSNATGDIIKSEVEAKQAVLLIDAADPNTQIFISKTVSLINGKIQSKNGDIMKDYSFFNPNIISLNQNGEQTEISIKK